MGGWMALPFHHHFLLQCSAYVRRKPCFIFYGYEINQKLNYSIKPISAT